MTPSPPHRAPQASADLAGAAAAPPAAARSPAAPVSPILTRRRVLAWGAFLAMTVVAPLLARKGFAVSLLCQIGIMTVFAVSYNMLLGQTGLLSFGHAIYYGLGAVTTIHALKLVGAGALPIPVTLLPLVGGLAGLAVGIAFGYVTTRRAGTTFAMISLGIGEMVHAGSMMFPGFFGGEGGVSGDRVTGKGLFGITYGPQLQMYYLIVAWAFVCLAAMYALSQTPLGRVANAVRDNPERVQFVGYDPQWVRYQQVVLAAFFAGVAGGLSALNYEIVTAESLGAHKSGIVLLMAYVGGVGTFYGPALGAAFVTVLQVAVASVTKAWLFYFGLFFVGMVLWAPGGLASVVAAHERVLRARMAGRVAAAYLLAAPPVALLAGGIVALVEMAYAAVNEVESGTAALTVAGLAIDPGRALPWVAAVAAVLAGGALLRLARRPALARWEEVHARLAALPETR